MRAVKFWWGVDSRCNDIYIEERTQDSWAITKLGFNMAKDGSWENEPFPSSRDNEFLQRCRYASPEEAEAQLIKTYDQGSSL